MAIQSCIPSPSFDALAARDTVFYGRRVLERGGPDIFSSGAADQILEFTRGLYALAGVRTDFFLLRSGYCAGTGTISQSVHGVPGVLTAGPTWGTDGIVFNGSNYITLPVGFPPDIRTCFCVFKNTGGSDTFRHLLNIESGGTNGNWSQFQYSMAGTGGSRLNKVRGGSVVTANPTTFFRTDQQLSNAFRVDDSSTRIWENGVQTFIQTGQAALTTPGTVNIRRIGHLITGSITLLVYSPITFNPASLHALAKQTICSGLGLP